MHAYVSVLFSSPEDIFIPKKLNQLFIESYRQQGPIRCFGFFSVIFFCNNIFQFKSVVIFLPSLAKNMTLLLILNKSQLIFSTLSVTISHQWYNFIEPERIKYMSQRA